MTNEAVFAMPLAKVYPLLEAKALRKGERATRCSPLSAG